MSVVVNVCGPNFSLMVSDNRLVKYDENNNIQIVSEDFKKIFRINENVLVGITGDAVQCQNVMITLQKSNPSKLNLIQTKEIITNTLKSKKSEINKLGVKIIVSGKQSNGSFITYVVDSKNDFKDIVYRPKENYNCLIYSVPKKQNPTDDYESIIDFAIKNQKCSSINDLVIAIGRAIYDISKLNIGVNGTISYEVIC